MPFSRIEDLFLVGDRASQPAANTVSVGTVYSVDDEGFLQEQSDGANWVQFGPDPAAGVAITALTGDVTATGPGSAAATIANGVVTLAKIADAAANSKLLGSGDAGSGNPYEEITLGTNLTMSGTTLNAASGSGGTLPSTNEYRLSATTAVPVTTADVTSTSTLYWVPYKGLHCSVYDGAAWQDYTGGELSIALSSLTADLPYDVFLDYNGGTEQLVLVAWTSDSLRATALTLQDGILVLTGATDHRYLGTIRTIATNATADSGGGTTTQVGGKRFIWNYYNRVLRTLAVQDLTDSWTYSTATWRVANGATGPLNCFEFVIGVAEDAVSTFLSAYGTVSGSPQPQSLAAMALDSTSVPSSLIRTGAQTDTSSTLQVGRGVAYNFIPAVGYHFVARLERGNGNATVTWHGDAGATDDVSSAMIGTIWS